MARLTSSRRAAVLRQALNPETRLAANLVFDFLGKPAEVRPGRFSLFRPQQEILEGNLEKETPMSQGRRALWLMLAAGCVSAVWPQTAAAQMFPYFRPGRRAATIMGGPLGPAPLDPLSVSAYWGFLPSPILARQAIGHQIIWTSPNGYVYRPVYADNDPTGAAQADGFKIVPRTAPAAAEPIAAPQAALAGQAPAGLRLPAADAQNAFERGLLLFRAGRYDEALADLERVPEAQGAEADLLAAQVLFASGDYATAIEALDRATEALPESQWGRYIADYRDYFSSPLRYVVHLRSLERYVDQFPQRPQAKLLLAYHYGSLGFVDQAIKLLDELQADPLVDRLRAYFTRQRAGPAPELNEDVRGPLLAPPGPVAQRAVRTGRPGPREF